MNALIVPMLTSESSRSSGTIRVNSATTMPVMTDMRAGVWKRGWMAATDSGSMRSRAMAKKMRDWPSSETSATDEVPASTPIRMIHSAQGACSGASADWSGVSTLTCCHGTAPTSTIATAQ